MARRVNCAQGHLSDFFIPDAGDCLLEEEEEGLGGGEGVGAKEIAAEGVEAGTKAEGDIRIWRRRMDDKDGYSNNNQNMINNGGSATYCITILMLTFYTCRFHTHITRSASDFTPSTAHVKL